MNTIGIVVVTLAVALGWGGCAQPTTSSSPSASPDFSAKARCERDGGIWRGEGICDVQAPPQTR